MFWAPLIFAAFAAAQASPAVIRLAPGQAVAVELGPGEVKEATLRLRAGESAEVGVVQRGVDVVVDVFSPSGTLLDSVDSPNGRQGPEPVSLMARESGVYRLRIRAIAPNEPRGRLELSVGAQRSVAQTRRLLAQQSRARGAAAQWLARQNGPLPAPAAVATADALPVLDALARSATVLGLGEATHGSREFNDFRLAVIQRLVARHGYRLIALEDSASRWRALEVYVAGRSAALPQERDWGWIGGRSRRALLDWVRRWNLEHPGAHVEVVGLDAQDNAPDRARLGVFLGHAYGAAAEAAWAPHEAELAGADAQAAVFGDSGTSAGLRQFIQEVVAQLAADAPLLRARFGEADYKAAFEAALNLAAFVDFNAGTGAISHSRDWHMAAALVRSMGERAAWPKTIYWAHNAHVSAAATRWGPTGALLRQALGCGYRALATTFGSGDFIAQVPGDPAARIVATALPAAPADEDRVETVLASIRPGAHISAWPCPVGAAGQPEWLRVERPLRWVGGLYAPNSPASASYRPYRLTAAFDAIAYFPVVTAEDVPVGRPVPPPRR